MAGRVAVSMVTKSHETLHDLLDDRPEKTVLPVETLLILRDEPLEMMEKHPVEDGPLRTSRTIDSHHGGR
jgi:hypothetical protein